MATEILTQLDNIEISLIKGVHGIFDVSVDGKLVFSKHDLGISKIDDVVPSDVIKKI